MDGRAGTVVLWTVPSQYIRLHFKHLIPAGVAPNKSYTYGQLSIDYDVPIGQLVIYLITHTDSHLKLGYYSTVSTAQSHINTGCYG